MGYIYCAGSMYYNAFPIALMYWSGGASLTVPLPYLYDLCLPVSDISGRPALWSSAGEELLVPGLATQVGSVEPSQHCWAFHLYVLPSEIHLLPTFYQVAQV